MTMTKIFTILFATLLVACGPKPTTQMIEVTGNEMAFARPQAQQSIRYSDPNTNKWQPTVSEITPERIKIVRTAVFRDDLAYNSVRGVYIITDTQTGKEYIGISGVGISETGSHRAGKSSVSDER
jgi:hypothetical protein